VATSKLVTIPPATVSVATAFYDSVSAAAKYLEDNSPGRHRRVIIVISDGDDNNSRRILEVPRAELVAAVTGTASQRLQAKHHLAVIDVQQAVQKADAIFYSVNPGGPSVRLNQMSLRAQSGMSTVAEATGGTAFLPDGEKDLEMVFRQVAAELRGQYLIGYYANADVPAGQFRRIAVTVPTRPQVKVRARQGYYAKQK